MISRVIILGANGMLGSTLKFVLSRHGFEVLALTRSDFNPLTNEIHELHRYINPTNTVLVNCIVNNPTSNSWRETVLVNSLFPRKLARYCNESNVVLIHVSTNGVFSGHRGSYTETDIPDSTTLYGISKHLGEDPLCVTLRTSFIGREKRAQNHLLEWAIRSRGGSLKGYKNHKWNGLTTVGFSNVIAGMIKERLLSSGVFHIYSPKVVSKYELLLLINNVYQLGLNVLPANAKEPLDLTLASVYGYSSRFVTDSIEMQLRTMVELESSEWWSRE